MFTIRADDYSQVYNKDYVQILDYDPVNKLFTMKLRIPDDIAVLGIGDYENSRFFDPPLSTIGAIQHQLGLEASRLLVTMLRGPTSSEVLQLEVPAEIMLRESTGHG